jgi:hypothetical protein
MDKEKLWRNRFLFLCFIILIIVLIVGGYFLSLDYAEKIREKTIQEFAQYQTSSQNLLFWNGSNILEVNINDLIKNEEQTGNKSD